MNRVELALTPPPFIAVLLRAEEPDLRQASKEAPTQPVRDEESVAVPLGCVDAGRILDHIVIRLRAHETPHEDPSRRRQKLYLVSLTGRMLGANMDGDSVGHDVLEVGFVEVDSFAEVTWARTTVTQILVHRLSAESAVSCEIRRHHESDIYCYVYGLKRGGKLETA